jgi:hypothetical protein
VEVGETVLLAQLEKRIKKEAQKSADEIFLIFYPVKVSYNDI